MEQNKEIEALFNLIDDPDEEVFSMVSARIVDYGKNIIPSLEHLWETSPDEGIQDRIERLIHRLHYGDLTEDLQQWSSSGHHDLLVGALLVSKFQYPDLSTAPVFKEIEKIRKTIWLELNNYLTALEQVRIVTNILYQYYQLKGNEISYQQPDEFLIHKCIETKRGNQLSNGVLYLILCEMLDIPVRAVNVPKQFVLAYFKNGNVETDPENPLEQIEFYIDPTSGQAFTHDDVEHYFSRLQVPPVNAYFRPVSNKKVIQNLLEEFGKCFGNNNDQYKQDELNTLANLLD